MKKIILPLLLLLSLPISIFAMNGDDWRYNYTINKDSNDRARELDYTEKQCLQALHLAKSSATKKQFCKKYLQEGVRIHSACATVCQYAETLEKEKSSK